MAPPSQAGKFKPRRAPKKIRPGAASAKDGKQPTPIVPGSSSSTPRPSSGGGSASSGGGRGTKGRGGRGGREGGRGGREGGRGGRGGRGRGRGRIPVQQGQAFFTGTQAAPTKVGSSARGASSGGLSKTAAAVARKLQANRGAVNPNQPPNADDMTPTEEIVGTMEEAVGAAAPDAVKSRAAASLGGGVKETENPDGGQVLEDESGFTYDSDSSRESRFSAGGRSRGPATEEPLRLPFPGPVSPMGIGSSALQNDDVPLVATSTVISQDPTRPSPFAQNPTKREQDSWFLVQLPTRLPPMKSSLRTEKDEGDGELPPAAEPDENNKFEVADVATKPVRVDHFDNTLAKTVPGKLGKIRVHKSGKTVLVLEAEDGSETLLQVSEGLACSFQQKAALIDVDEANFVSLGDVGKTVVMTPNLG